MAGKSWKPRWINSGKRERKGWEITWMMRCQSKQRCKFKLKAHARVPQTKSTWNSDTCANTKTADYKRMLILFVVDSIKLNLTAFNAISQPWVHTGFNVKHTWHFSVSAASRRVTSRARTTPVLYKTKQVIMQWYGKSVKWNDNSPQLDFFYLWIAKIVLSF